VRHEQYYLIPDELRDFRGWDVGSTEKDGIRFDFGHASVGMC